MLSLLNCSSGTTDSCHTVSKPTTQTNYNTSRPVKQDPDKFDCQGK